MEVHAHGHVHEQKKWKEYVFQFIMLFLAVFLGFLTENLREKGVEKNVEHEYVASLSVDLVNDSLLADRNQSSIFGQAKKIDTLQDLFLKVVDADPEKDSIARECYRMSGILRTFFSEFFNERTISQLLSSGSMRLIKKQGVADRIMGYHNLIKFLEVQNQLYIQSMNTARDAMFTVYDIKDLRSFLYNDTFYNYNLDTRKCQLATTNPTELKKFIAILENAKAIAFTYKGYLEIMKEESSGLREFIRESYALKD